MKTHLFLLRNADGYRYDDDLALMERSDMFECKHVHIGNGLHELYLLRARNVKDCHMTDRQL